MYCFKLDFFSIKLFVQTLTLPQKKFFIASVNCCKFVIILNLRLLVRARPKYEVFFLDISI